MRNFTKYFTMLAALAFVSVACSDDNDGGDGGGNGNGNDPVELNIVTQEADHVFPYTGGNHTVTISSNYEWGVEFEGNSEWFKHTVSGSNILFTVDKNGSAKDSYQTKVVITAGDGEDQKKSVSFNLSQGPNLYYLTAEKVVGVWNLYADHWSYVYVDDDDEAYTTQIPGSATYTSATIEIGEEDNTFIMKGLFLERLKEELEDWGMGDAVVYNENVLKFDAETGALSLLTDKPSAFIDYTSYGDGIYDLYLMGFDTTPNVFLYNPETGQSDLLLKGENHVAGPFELTLSDDMRTIYFPEMEYGLNTNELISLEYVGLGLGLVMLVDMGSGVEQAGDMSFTYYAHGDNIRMVKE